MLSRRVFHGRHSAVRGPDYGNEGEYLRVFINQLRKKIESAPPIPSIFFSPNPPPVPLCSQRQGLRKIIILFLYGLCGQPVF
jgi:hypothetical protein